MLLLVIAIILIGITLAGGAWLGLASTHTTYTGAATPVIQFAQEQDPPQFSVLLSRSAVANQGFLVCRNGHCRTMPKPSGKHDAITNGTAWFYYRPAPVDSNTTGRSLHKLLLANKKQSTIIESTPLTSPRDLIPSPDGQRLAFWLDNTFEPKKQLTELWVYDAATNDVRLVVEKLHVPDIRSAVQWSSDSTYLWFIADSAELNQPDKIEFIVARTDPPQVSVTFNEIDWAQVSEQEEIILDINQQGNAVAFVDSTVRGQTRLNILESKQPEAQLIRGSVPFIQWNNDNSLLYAIQNNDNFTFWRRASGIDRFVAHRPGQLLSASRDGSGEYIAYVVREAAQLIRLYLLHVESGKVFDQGVIPTGGQAVKLLQVTPDEIIDISNDTGVTAVYDDSQIAAFIENRLAEITSSPTVEPTSLVFTQDDNTLFVDYRDGNKEHRLLLRINDIPNPEWEKIAQYETIRGEWHRIGDTNEAEPVASRLYDWEAALGQWILKESYQFIK